MAENKKSSINNKSTCHLLNIKQPERAHNRLKFTFQRTSAVISLLKLDRNVNASISMVDISESGAGVFTSELLLKGSTVELCLTEPRILKVKCLVAWSVPVQSGINNKRYPFRSGLQFVFQNEIQRSAVVEFLKKISTDPLENMKTSIQEMNSVSNADSGAPQNPAVGEVPPQAPVATTEASPAAPSADAAVTPPPAGEVTPAPEASSPASAENPPAASAEAVAPTAPSPEAATPVSAETIPPSTEGGGGSQAA